jgi:hypothetical protein
VREITYLEIEFGSSGLQGLGRLELLEETKAKVARVCLCRMAWLVLWLMEGKTEIVW